MAIASVLYFRNGCITVNVDTTVVMVFKQGNRTRVRDFTIIVNCAAFKYSGIIYKWHSL